jgi:hypothetical protein
MNDNLQIQQSHLRRAAYVYIRQSSATQVLVNRESTDRQYQLSERAIQLGWSKTQIKLIDHNGKNTDMADSQIVQSFTGMFTQVSVRIRIRIRGSHRRKTCSFPPPPVIAPGNSSRPLSTTSRLSTIALNFL